MLCDRLYLQKVLRAGTDQILFSESFGETHLVFAVYVFTSNYVCSVYGHLDTFEHSSCHDNGGI